MRLFITALTLVCGIGLATGKGILINQPAALPRSAIKSPIPAGYRRWDDMILPDAFFSKSKNESRNAIVDPNLKWPGGRIPYVIDGSLAYNRGQITAAMNEYHAKTCIRFVPRSNEYNYVRILADQGCYSLIGRAGQGEQPISLGQGCMVHGTIVHELGHAIGFHHEQNRSDRDDYITISWENIQQGYESQFEKLDPSQNWLINAFDTNSIMMYGETAFSNDGYSQTMTSLYGQQLLETYQKSGLSYSDVQRVNTLYGC